MNDAIIFVSAALFIVWEQRNKGWKYLWGALSGTYTVVPLGTGSIPGQAGLTTNNQSIIATHNSTAGATQIVPGKGVGPTVTTNGVGRGSGSNTSGPPTVGLG